MNDKVLKALLKDTLENIGPPTGLRGRMLSAILKEERELPITPLERFVFNRPLRCAFVFSVALSFVLYAVFGNAYLGILSGL